MHDSVKKLKIQLIGAALTVVVSAVALSATTYAWFFLFAEMRKL